MKQGDNVFYYIKQASLEPDKYGKHIKIKMISAYTGAGKFIKHVKLDEVLLDKLKKSCIIPPEPELVEGE